jgi:hypothetical protein
MTIGSPLLSASHGPPKPRQSELPGAGPNRSVGGVVADP